ncbi:hypothetical protein CBR_g50116 [Chara braunii]|uniref:tRNA pseudouridine(55) synthase n=1 Tax=Chara braunii TaxID=69332 RepID=A0A388M6B6_CHABU|nr:hypothetical protein CBR_g50116 [Chara braunii]|eukprot:GBG90023.1 hypothetical protein CBR_g50116 [Chara braunii]
MPTLDSRSSWIDVCDRAWYRSARVQFRDLQHFQWWLPRSSQSILGTEPCPWPSSAEITAGGGGGGGAGGKRRGGSHKLCQIVRFPAMDAAVRGVLQDQLCSRSVLFERGEKKMIRVTVLTARVAMDGSAIGEWPRAFHSIPSCRGEGGYRGWRRVLKGVLASRESSVVTARSLRVEAEGGGQSMAVPPQQDGRHGEKEATESGAEAKRRGSRARAPLSLELTMEQAAKEALDEHAILKGKKRLGKRREKMLARREEMMQKARETDLLAESDGVLGLENPFSLSLARPFSTSAISQQQSRSSLSRVDGKNGSGGSSALLEQPEPVPRHLPIMVKKPIMPSRWDSPGGCVILMDKPKDWTSFAVCARVRSLVKVKKVGHAGTLDPMATGLLILCVGKATKLVDNYQALQKTYTGTIRLGEATSSYDAETDVVQQLPWEHISDEDIQDAAKNFIGNIMQVPPIFSAIKVKGERLYEKGRRGETIDIPPRPLVVYDFQLKRSKSNRQHIDFKVECSKGTYVRSLANDLGRALGSCGHLVALRREKIGDFSVRSAWTVDEFTDMQKQNLN